jgi:hypothetical protein
MQRFYPASDRHRRGYTLPRRRAYRDLPPGPPSLAQALLEDPGVLAPRPEEACTGDPLVLVVSRERAAALPMLREILQGEPEVSIVVDRRFAERRRAGGTANPPVERRLAERRRRFSFHLL